MTEKQQTLQGYIMNEHNFNEDTNFTSSDLQMGPRTSKHILKIIKLQMKITRQNKQVITIQFLNEVIKVEPFKSSSKLFQTSETKFTVVQ